MAGMIILWAVILGALFLLGEDGRKGALLFAWVALAIGNAVLLIV